MLLKRFLLVNSLLMCCLSGFAQIVTLKGSVTDKQSHKTIPGVSVKIGQYGTSTDAEGRFVILVQKKVAEQEGLSFTSVGYQKAKLAYADKDLNIALTPAATDLNEVIISVKSESIIHKAIRKIPENYPLKDFLLTGALRIVNLAKDKGVDQYFYKSDADLQVYFPAYTKNKSPDIELIHKQDTLIENPDNKPYVRWVNGYTGLAYNDYVHERPEFLKQDTKKYNYVLNGKDWINNTRVYVVNFFSNQKIEDAGTMYIDTANYAFVRISLTNYNVKRAFQIDLDKITNIINYKNRNGKWYIEATETNVIARHNGFDLFRTFNFQTSAIELNDVKPIPYEDILATSMEDVRIGNPKTLHAPQYNTFSSTAASPFSAITIPKIDTIRTKQKTWRDKLAFLPKVANYLVNDNIRSALGVSSLPLQIDGYQPVLGKDLSQVSNYAINYTMQFRLKQELFLQLDGLFNLGIGGIKNNETTYGLLYNIKLNGSGHPIFLSPSIAFSELKIYQKETDWYKQKSATYGLTFSYESSPRRIWYVVGKYYDPSSTSNNGLLLRTHPVTIGAGLIFKRKI